MGGEQTEKKGYGVRTREDIAQSSVVGEYVGEIIDQRELARRLKSVPRVRDELCSVSRTSHMIITFV